MSYQHLTQDQRYQIERLHKEGFSSRATAALIACHPSTVARERRRNRDEKDGYRAAHAQGLARVRRRVASARARIDDATWARIEHHLRQDWPPEVVVGRGIAKVSIERIYQHIASDKAAGGDLWTHRRRRKRRRSRIGTSRHRQRFAGRTIDTRPEHIQARKQVGHWEADSVVGTGSVRLITLVERKSRYLRLRRVVDGKSRAASEAIIQALHCVRGSVKTLTYDNGSEFAEHALVDQVLGSTAYFADPHAPWQRGSNENANGLVRQYLPKGTSMNELTDETLQIIEDKLNDRPRKTLGFKTPSEVFFASFNRRTS